jgi:phospholipid/cholesterol/gamma-HCH transport system permease protein
MNSVLAFISRRCILAAGALGGVSSLFFTSNYWTFVAPFRCKELRWRATLRQMVVVGFDAIPLVSVISFFIGLIIALQGAYSFRNFGALNFVVGMVAITSTWELGPLMTAILVLGRSGSAFAAEIGTMKVGEEVDVLETMGLNSVKFLVVPKYLVMLVMLVMLNEKTY